MLTFLVLQSKNKGHYYNSDLINCIQTLELSIVEFLINSIYS